MKNWARSTAQSSTLVIGVIPRSNGKIKLLNYDLNYNKVIYESQLFDCHQKRNEQRILKPNKNNPLVFYYQSSSKYISTLELDKDHVHALNIFYKHAKSIVEFGHIRELKQFWLMSLPDELSFVDDENGRTLKKFKIAKPVLECNMILKGFDNLLL